MPSKAPMYGIYGPETLDIMTSLGYATALNNYTRGSIFVSLERYDPPPETIGSQYLVMLMFLCALCIVAAFFLWRKFLRPRFNKNSNPPV
jgi:hypothetical protein